MVRVHLLHLQCNGRCIFGDLGKIPRATLQSLTGRHASGTRSISVCATAYTTLTVQASSRFQTSSECRLFLCLLLILSRNNSPQESTGKGSSSSSRPRGRMMVGTLEAWAVESDCPGAVSCDYALVCSNSEALMGTGPLHVACVQ